MHTPTALPSALLILPTYTHWAPATWGNPLHRGFLNGGPRTHDTVWFLCICIVFSIKFHSILRGFTTLRPQIYSHLCSELPWPGPISRRGTGWLEPTSRGSLGPVMSPPWSQLSRGPYLKVTNTFLHTNTCFSPRGPGAPGGLRSQGTAPAWCRFCSPGRGSQLRPGHWSAHGCLSAARQKLAQREARETADWGRPWV